ncbi:MAG: alpha/beta hydrolase [Solirubrobacterales bacterium]|nr:alpha/beta hydrolase [Solirubrobacterales bacterium]
MPFGLLIPAILVGTAAALCLLPSPRSWRARRLVFFACVVLNEQPHWFAALIFVSAVLAIVSGDITSTVGWLAIPIAAIVIVELGVILRRARPSRRILREEIRRELGDEAVRRLAGPAPVLSTLLRPWPVRPRRVRRIGPISYGPEGRMNLLDVYLPRTGEVSGPTLVFLHGGGFHSGSRRRESKAMFHRLAGEGWFCVSADYRVGRSARFPDYVIDLKRVIAWVRGEGVELGADPDRLFVAGSSAGAHIASVAALTPGRPEFQPGFEEVDTRISGVIGMGGYYSRIEFQERRYPEVRNSGPADYLGPGAPPFLIVHGDHDSLVPLANPDAFVRALREAGASVTEVILPGAHHGFDLTRSLRSESVVDAIQDFTGAVTGPDRACRNLL